MIALNFDGQFKIDEIKMRRIYNQKKMDKLIFALSDEMSCFAKLKKSFGLTWVI